MTPAALTTERLVLRPPVPEDLDRCAELLGDYEVAKMLTVVSHPYDLRAGRDFLAKAARGWADWQNADELVFQIDREGQMIGCLSFGALQETPRIGYWLGRPYWGKSYMSEAVRAAADWLFRNTDHALIVSRVMTENAASLTVMEKAGFRVVGDGTCQSLARGRAMPAWRTELSRADFYKGL
ncbi:GNAT family N-acetyltransferase [Roseibium sp. RKSG952]|uniref:GNAT family N-acetyltransferase n=1 Tax=Roseibium sp. RKSG952 TaxID=2529384 RepID=UPI0012BC46F8|nr:GNAT family N-acetyltransferase [Roseibium sp. RKSG952]MTH95114.1 N-acetyltransferase [Roseibium sp. RKSG952]